MEYLQTDFLGASHLGFAILSLVLGPVTLFQKKGSKAHRYWGYAYLICMVGVNASALMIYKLFGSFGPFHYAAVFGLLSLLAGFIPVYFKKPENSWLEYHYEFMAWSVVGLYAAFWAETFTRFIRVSNFWMLVIFATLMTSAVGYYFIRRNKAKLLARYQK